MYVVIIIILIFVDGLPISCLPICLINMMCLTELDFAWFKCSNNFVNHQLSIQFQVPTFNQSMLKRNAHHQCITWWNMYVSFLNIFGCLAQMVGLLSSYLSITHWTENNLCFDFVVVTLLLIVINWMWASSYWCDVVIITSLCNRSSAPPTLNILSHPAPCLCVMLDFVGSLPRENWTGWVMLMWTETPHCW